MDISASASWLNQTFSTFDSWGLNLMNQFSHSPLGHVLQPLSVVFDWLGKKGILMILLGLTMSSFPKTRKMGIAVLIALLLGAVITNAILKPLILRPRPYSEGYENWWMQVGSHLESDASFPSGHTTAAMAIATTLFFMGGWSLGWMLFLFAGTMAFSRCYLMVHYPSDVVVALLLGFMAGSAAVWITNQVWNWRVIQEGLH